MPDTLPPAEPTALTASAPQVIVLGAIVFDRVLEVRELPLRPIKVRATDWQERCGGPAATAAVTVAALGLRASLWARVGDDAEGRLAMEALHRHGVDTRGMLCFPGGSTARSILLVDPSGERLIAGYQVRGVSTSTEPLRLQDVPDAAAVLADDSWPEGAAALFRAARQAGAPSVLDGDIGTSDPEVLRELSSLCGHAVYSEVGWQVLTGLTRPDEHLMRDFARRFGNVIGVTQGAQGSWWCVDGQIHHVPAHAVPVVDTTGAGDVFHGAFAAALAQGRPVLQAAAWASAAAAIKCGLGWGWAGMPTAAGVQALMRGARAAQDGPLPFATPPTL